MPKGSAEHVPEIRIASNRVLVFEGCVMTCEQGWLCSGMPRRGLASTMGGVISATSLSLSELITRIDVIPMPRDERIPPVTLPSCNLHFTGALTAPRVTPSRSRTPPTLPLTLARQTSRNSASVKRHQFAGTSCTTPAETAPRQPQLTIAQAVIQAGRCP